MNLEAYFERISYTGSREPTLETLYALHRQHQYVIPFETLDIHLPRTIVLENDRIFEKLINERRGGFCYEQNGLFSQVLRELGYQDITLLEAQVYDAQGNLSVRFDHLALTVTIAGERWLVDVGFGSKIIEPLRLDDPGEQSVEGRIYRVQHNGEQGHYSKRDENGGWMHEYLFYLQPRTLVDFADTCRYHQTPESPFSARRMATMPSPDGRVTYQNDTLTIRKGDEYTEYLLHSEDEIRAALKKHFGIELPQI